MIRPKVPQSDGLVQGAREEGVVRWVHGQRDHPLVVAAKVAYVLVLFE